MIEPHRFNIRVKIQKDPLTLVTNKKGATFINEQARHYRACCVYSRFRVTPGSGNAVSTGRRARTYSIKARASVLQATPAVLQFSG